MSKVYTVVPADGAHRMVSSADPIHHSLHKGTH